MSPWRRWSGEVGAFVVYIPRVQLHGEQRLARQRSPGERAVLISQLCPSLLWQGRNERREFGAVLGGVRPGHPAARQSSPSVWMNSAPIPAPMSNARPPTQNRVLAGAVADRPGVPHRSAGLGGDLLTGRGDDLLGEPLDLVVALGPQQEGVEAVAHHQLGQLVGPLP